MLLATAILICVDLRCNVATVGGKGRSHISGYARFCVCELVLSRGNVTLCCLRVLENAMMLMVNMIHKIIFLM